MRDLNEIIIHCSATRPEWMASRSAQSKMTEIRRWHMQERKWRDIGYHYLTDRSGTTVIGRPLEQIGAHVVDHNRGTIGICLIGGHGSAATDPFLRNFTPAQDKALRNLIAQLQATYPTIRRITGHNDYAAKACPGFKVAEWL